jgi:anhydro-N-acetylmuramic acid kinase
MTPPAPDAGGLYIGLMSGTSTDGVDAVLASFGPGQAPRHIATATVPFEDALRTELLALNSPGLDELHRSALASQMLARKYAQAVQDILGAAKASRPLPYAPSAHMVRRCDIDLSWVTLCN